MRLTLSSHLKHYSSKKLQRDANTQIALKASSLGVLTEQYNLENTQEANEEMAAFWGISTAVLPLTAALKLFKTCFKLLNRDHII